MKFIIKILTVLILNLILAPNLFATDNECRFEELANKIIHDKDAKSLIKNKFGYTILIMAETAGSNEDESRKKFEKFNSSTVDEQRKMLSKENLTLFNQMRSEITQSSRNLIGKYPEISNLSDQEVIEFQSSVENALMSSNFFKCFASEAGKFALCCGIKAAARAAFGVCVRLAVGAEAAADIAALAAAIPEVMAEFEPEIAATGPICRWIVENKFWVSGLSGCVTKFLDGIVECAGL